VANSADDSVSVVNTATDMVEATILGLSTPQGVAVDPAGARAYIAEQSASRVAMLNTQTNTLTTLVPVGSSPVGVAVRPIP
jgi:YVTN family beta-propeller protein